MVGFDLCVPALSRGHTASQVGSDMWLRSVCIRPRFVEPPTAREFTLNASTLAAFVE
jgi:hypothetical protein